ncbi:MAG TPA: magnesium-translocating P-type ATPase [Vicinamibacterales bacterium]|nr:magnesium-translocating P-type ATPase [Vicinamibacterales bacterium]
MTSANTDHEPTRGLPWVSWLLGAALLGAVVAAALHFSEEQAFVGLVKHAEPWWLAVAMVLQAGTYLAQGGIWRRVGIAAGYHLEWKTAFELGLAKLFADQALPSAGLSSSVLIAQALTQRQLPSAAASASVLVNIASYHLAYAVALAGALAIMLWRGHSNAVVIVMAVLFLVFSLGLSSAVLVLSGRPHERLARRLRRFPWVRTTFEFIAGADPGLVRSRRLLAEATGIQLAIVFLDAATVWTLIAALGTVASASGVFASFMIATLFRTMGIVPGGLGTFEATSVFTLRMVGVDLAVALSATLLFRGLSFWLPMLPGYWFSRRAIAPRVRPTQAGGSPPLTAYWTLDASEVAQRLTSGPEGLSGAEAATRLREHGPNELRERRTLSRLGVLVRQSRSPLLLLLVFAAGASAVTGQWLDAAIVVTIVMATVGIGYSREYRAQTVAGALRARLHVRASVLRDGQARPLPPEEVVPGDVVLLSAGSLVPADAVILQATDFFVSEAVLTGESFPVHKKPGVVDRSAGLGARTNCVFVGTNVRSGVARCLVVRTGSKTEFGAIAHRLTLRPPETEFDRGIRRFGYLLTSAMLIMVLLVFAAHMFGGRPPVETLLFAVALAVGLSPELLPAILSVNLARGAQMMARRGVLVRRLNAIENLGSLSVLCMDKTGTLTEGVVELEGAYDGSGQPSQAVLDLGACNAALETGVASPLDDAITNARRPDLDTVRKLGEIPFDFVRKRVTVVVQAQNGARLITKGAFHHVMDVCTRSGDDALLDADGRAELERRYDEWTGRGIRVLAVAARAVEQHPVYSRDDERDMIFMGFLTFLDRPKEGVADALAELAALGVSVKLVTGDSRLVAQHIATLVGMRADRVLTGRQLDELNDEALWRVAETTDLFVEVDPNQKERIILSLKKMGHVVGFLGDGVNDAPAMHAADTSLSVEAAVDVAREAADFVLLERSLDVIRQGIEEGRRTFANTLKYILITTSANLGNMVSMAAVSLFLPFLPLTAGQILLNNFLSDVPAVGIADDSVDAELVDRPRRWDIRFIGRYMVEFGILSSLFDLLMFGVLLGIFRAGPDVFRTGWFVESLLTELVVALVIRTRRPFYRSRPGTLLLVSTAGLIAFAFAVPYLPLAELVGFVPIPGTLLATIMLITVGYVAATEAQKRWFYRHAT